MRTVTNNCAIWSLNKLRIPIHFIDILLPSHGVRVIIQEIMVLRDQIPIISDKMISFPLQRPPIVVNSFHRGLLLIKCFQLQPCLLLITRSAIQYIITPCALLRKNLSLVLLIYLLVCGQEPEAERVCGIAEPLGDVDFVGLRVGWFFDGGVIIFSSQVCRWILKHIIKYLLPINSILLFLSEFLLFFGHFFSL